MSSNGSSLGINETANSETPRTLLQNVLGEQKIQQTVKKKKSYLSRIKSVPSNVSRNSDAASALDVSVTPRTALEHVMLSHDVMNTVAHSTRQRRVFDRTTQSTAAPIPQPSDEDTADIPLPRRPLKNIVDRIIKSQPGINMNEYNDRLRQKIAEWKSSQQSNVHDHNETEQLGEEVSFSEQVTRPGTSLEKSDVSTHKEPLVELEHQHSETATEPTIADVEEDHFHASSDDDTGQVISLGSPHQPNIEPSNIEGSDSASRNDDVVPPSEDEIIETSGNLLLNSLHGNTKYESDDSAYDPGHVTMEQPEIIQQPQEACDNTDAPQPPTPQPTTNKPKKSSLKVGPAPSLRKLSSVKRTVKQTKRPSQSSIIPRTQLKGILQHYCSNRITKEAVDEAEGIFATFLKKLSQDMEAVCTFAGRSTINKDDLELIMKRQRFVTKERPLNVIIEEMFPLEYRRLFIPVAQSCQLSPPAKKRKTGK